MKRERIAISAIDASGRLRPINPDWVETLAEQIATGITLPAIEVVERKEGYRLIAGGHRLKAHEKAGLDVIEADVCPANEFADEAAVRLREIQENMLRYELTALDRAVHLATWKELHESVAGPAKRGRKKATEELPQNSAAIFAGTFSKAAAKALKVSERAVQAAVQVATGIAPDVRERIAFLKIADTMSELIELSKQARARQDAIAGLLTSEPPAASTVADAIAIIDRRPPPRTLEQWEAASSRFGRLSDAEQDRFFEANAAAVDRWLARRRQKAA
ncbi:ParB family chromosome partitioning protein [Rhodobium orientis]|uniref:ParB-like N-terminal domain-containing protein n=1 Tax=Rhodobium orientis TaxID=34017 RepID=A0A327JU29_9HYPH|nr:ParB N-terminal domain-containing protein [Rhodobium orientis]MBB4302316.1 ParB family chromosome partitioning protein [Rhodobium orientis]MBK5949024.1 hypothetical protein [Rhodobium orientis]RAI29016.1 hypothetical protein CH339_04850 [Rhodobium orientis]